MGEVGLQRGARAAVPPGGDRNALLTTADLKAVDQPLAAVVIELPQRDIGGRLPALEDLAEQTGWARSTAAAAHCDGARIRAGAASR